MLPGGRRLFHPRGQVRGLPHRGVVHVEVVANGADHHLAGVEADAHLQFQALRAADILAYTRAWPPACASAA